MSSSSRDKELLLSFISQNTPKTVTEIAKGLNLEENDVRSLVASLLEDGSIIKTEKNPERFGTKFLNLPQHDSNSYDNTGRDSTKTSDKKEQTVSRPSSETVHEEDILVYVFDHGPKTLDEIAQAFSISRNTAKKKVDLLQSDGVATLIKSNNGPSRVYITPHRSHHESAYDENGNPTISLDAMSDSAASWDFFKTSGQMQAWLDKKKEERRSNNKSNPTIIQKKPMKEQVASMDAENVALVYHGHNVVPCFKVNDVADAFISVIDSLSSLKPDSISMLGLFAAWGRGKSYLFDIVKNKLITRPNKTIQYDVIEFNAWKYQSVPAIWASMFETIYHYKSHWFRLWFMIKQNVWPVLRDLLLFVSVPFVIWLLTFIPDLSEWAEQYKHLPLWSLLISFTAFLIKLFSNEQKGIQQYIRKIFKGISFSDQLGVQAEIEKNLAKYLKQWIHDCNTKKVILYVEDVDRCDSRKMIDIIESLRTIIEQPDIRKRLIVVMSIDPEQLWKAIELKYKELYDGEKLHQNIVDHFDKLFTASITLSNLESEDELEFLKALELSTGDVVIGSRLENLIEFTKDESGSSGSASSTGSREKVANESIENRSYRPDDYRDVIRLISNSLHSLGQPHLTPRQISCVFYRSLLAVNLLASSSSKQRIDSSLTDQILVRSYLHNRKDLVKETPYESILKMVIPYPAEE